ncbi:MAG TPA: complex I subunit 1 family protein, partial [Nitriliruptorales bacterium]|nr:complex I subunit 1 family protein [Nitriliruptorales bacterium]
MVDVAHVSTLVGVLTVGTSLVLGAYVVAVLDEVIGARVGGDGGPITTALVTPWRRGAILLTQQRLATERPDATTWAIAPATYTALAAAALTVVPLSPSFVVADVRAGIVLYGAAEVLAMIAIFLNGWSPNSVFGLVGGYRFVALAVSYTLLSMFVLIAVALPAESLQMSEIVRAQQGLWNVVRQPLGLPLFLVVASGIAFWGPLNLADASDLAGGSSAEASGSHLLVWKVARGAMLTAGSAVGATAFLGGWLGPWLPGPVWVALKTSVLLAVLVASGHLLGRMRVERVVTVFWTVLLPLAFLDLALAGLVA